MATPPPSPFAFESFSSELSESYNLNSSSAEEEEEKKRISAKHLLSKRDNNSGTSYKGKLLASAPISSLKRSKSDEPLIYQTSEGNEDAFVPDRVEINFNDSFGSWDERRFKLSLLCDDSKDEVELQMEKEDKEKTDDHVDKEGKKREEDEK